MPSAARSTTPVGIDLPIIEGRYAELADYTVAFETYPEDVNPPAPYFVGLPGDACVCEHLGYVTAGQITFRWPDHAETYVAGDAYVAPAGTPSVDRGRHLDRGVQPHRRPAAGDGGHRWTPRGAGPGRRRNRGLGHDRCRVPPDGHDGPSR